MSSGTKRIKLNKQTLSCYVGTVTLGCYAIVVAQRNRCTGKLEEPGPDGYKILFKLNSTEHEISTSHKTKLPTNEKKFLALSLSDVYLSC